MGGWGWREEGGGGSEVQGGKGRGGKGEYANEVKCVGTREVEEWAALGFEVALKCVGILMSKVEEWRVLDFSVAGSCCFCLFVVVFLFVCLFVFCCCFFLGGRGGGGDGGRGVGGQGVICIEEGCSWS